MDKTSWTHCILCNERERGYMNFSGKPKSLKTFTATIQIHKKDHLVCVNCLKWFVVGFGFLEV